jgi:hypothetical protein
MAELSLAAAAHHLFNAKWRNVQSVDMNFHFDDV